MRKRWTLFHRDQPPSLIPRGWFKSFLSHSQPPFSIAASSAFRITLMKLLYYVDTREGSSRIYVVVVDVVVIVGCFVFSFWSGKPTVMRLACLAVNPLHFAPPPSYIIVAWNGYVNTCQGARIIVHARARSKRNGSTTRVLRGQSLFHSLSLLLSFSPQL